MKTRKIISLPFFIFFWLPLVLRNLRPEYNPASIERVPRTREMVISLPTIVRGMFDFFRLE
ncbi:hypothetical protein P175DRAFT_0503429 [Aspergillus ochraceoroseus IBT 24754]|uniref:Uncharacterized protein n=1 Tax=Aspergillus ochraceoroseus IBT 24754 TaxID=1392256 RepID=A0A2T5LQR7_9EURO|nr:uncharacterized protein P175DRAFT_0503429 [Aspergillus ochraceoroseus IBT 24754]PTU18631.1 hypothetical protein P175DRAFT_0503429 [Aspergillus ochraceoroseus IBT 24754]